MSLREHIERVRDRLRSGEFQSEAAISQGIVLPTLQELEWPVFNISVVTPEYSVGGGRVDYGLCHPENRPAVFVEVKQPGKADGADRQLFEYAFHLGVPMAVLTTGQEWSVYLPGEQGAYDERRVYKLDLLERDLDECIDVLERYLQYGRVCNKEALKAARDDYRNVARIREIKETIPKAWENMLHEPDSLLLETLAEKVEDICGFKPTLEQCEAFLQSTPTGRPVPAGQPTRSRTLSPTPTARRRNRTQPAPVETPAPTPRRSVQESPGGPFDFTFDGRTIPARSGREAMIRLFQLLAEADETFLERFASRKHGKKRRYISQAREELYPGRPDLVEGESRQFVSGWWIGTNYSSGNIQQIIDLAFEVAPPDLRGRIQIRVA